MTSCLKIIIFLKIANFLTVTFLLVIIVLQDQIIYLANTIHIKATSIASANTECSNHKNTCIKGISMGVVSDEKAYINSSNVESA